MTWGNQSSYNRVANAVSYTEKSVLSKSLKRYLTKVTS
nr:MAG TPA: hypothetical protein [Caudoviricetes sp.]